MTLTRTGPSIRNKKDKCSRGKLHFRNIYFFDQSSPFKFQAKASEPHAARQQRWRQLGQRPVADQYSSRFASAAHLQLFGFLQTPRVLRRSRRTADETAAHLALQEAGNDVPVTTREQREPEAARYRLEGCQQHEPEEQGVADERVLWERYDGE